MTRHPVTMRGLLLVLCGAMLVTSCSDGGGGDADVDTDVDTDTDSDTDTGTAVTITGNIRDASTFAALDQARVCLRDQSAVPCAHTDVEGSYDMEVPASSDLVFEVTKADYWSYLTNYSSTDADFEFPSSFFMFTEAEVIAGAATLGETLDPLNGHLWVMVSDAVDGNSASGLEGATPELEAAAGGVMFFVEPNLLLSKTRTSTSSNGSLGYLNVKPGDWTIAIDHPDHPCKPDYAFAGATAETFEVHVVAGYTTYIAVYCED